MSHESPITILAFATDFKGADFMQECKRQGCKVILLMSEKDRDEPWPWDSIDEHFRMEDLSKQPDITYAVSYLTRTQRIDRIVALDDFDVGTAAHLREHMRLPGMNESTARLFRDKLAMRQKAQDEGILVPNFQSIFNYDDVRAFLNQVPPPWVLKPRFAAGAVGIEKLNSNDSAWKAIQKLGNKQSFYLLEQFVPGDVYHVDSLVWDGQLVFSVSSKYGTPPLAVTTGGGIFTTRTLDPQSEEAQALQAKTQELITTLGMKRGVTHTEFIRSHANGRFYFLETAARVGGANVDKPVSAATGVVLWAEAARMTVADVRGEPYQLPSLRQKGAGMITCLAKQKRPDLSAYDDSEIVWRMTDKDYHASLMVASPDYNRVAQLLDQYSERFARDFLAVAPPKQDVRTSL